MEGFSLNCVELQEFQPNRYPFLMIDHIEGVSSITKDRLISLAKDNSFNKMWNFLETKKGE